MPSELSEALSAVFDRVKNSVLGNPEFRNLLRALAEAVLSASETPEPSRDGVAESPVVEEPSPPPVSETVEPGPEIETAPASESAEPLPPLLLGRGAPAEPEQAASTAARRAWPPSWQTVSDADLPWIEQRCRLKAQGARWAAARLQRIREGGDFATDIEPRDREIILEAKALPDCYLWMNTRNAPSPSDLSLFDHVAGSFDAVASAIALIRTILNDLEGHRDIFEQALNVLAEAQSALRQAIHWIDGPIDADQQKIYNWLRLTTSQHEIFVRRHMRADDPAEPRSWSGIQARIETLDAEFQEAQKRQKQRRKLLGKMRYLLKSVTSSDGDSAEHWRSIGRTIDELVSDGLPPSNVEIRDMLLPVIETVPDMDDWPPSFRLVLREVDHFLATRESTADEEATHEPSGEVTRAARLLTGKSAVLIGGERRPHAYYALKAALGLKDLVWFEGKEHTSIEPVEPYVARPDVALVLLAIRWSSHSFGEVKEYCDRHGKPLVRLPGGYNPNQVAAQILTQCSQRLEEV